MSPHNEHYPTCCSIIPLYIFSRIADHPDAPTAARIHARDTLRHSKVILVDREVSTQASTAPQPSNSTHSSSGIVPGYVLSSMANSSQANTNARDAAKPTLVSIKDLQHQSPSLAALYAGRKKFNTPRTPNRFVYTAQNTFDPQRFLLRSEGWPASQDQSANECYDGFGATFNFYSNIFDRNSINNQGMPLMGAVHYGLNFKNALWRWPHMLFGDGDGVYLNSFTSSIDIIGHELTHGVTHSTANLQYQGEPGAVNESMSDVFGSMVKQYYLNHTAAQADWLIGTSIFTPIVGAIAVRSMKNPGTAYNHPVVGRDRQLATYADILANPLPYSEDFGGVHIYSGVPNRAFYLIAVALGGYSWDRAGKIWYATLTGGRLHYAADIHSLARLTRDYALSLYDNQVKLVVEKGWRDVGVEIAETPKPPPPPPPRRQTVAGSWAGTRSRDPFTCVFSVSGSTLKGWGVVNVNGTRNSFKVMQGIADHLGGFSFTAKFDDSGTSSEEYFGNLSASGNTISGNWENSDRAAYLRAGWTDSDIIHGPFNASRQS